MDGENETGMVSIEDRLGRPTLPAQPDQAHLGSQTYYYVCMTCHGDQGQGLTTEWIQTVEMGEQSCWQSRCHASNHPPEGFVLPKYIPPVVGPVFTARFGNAQEVYDYIHQRMPWHMPGSLSEQEYWDLTAFLLRLNGIQPLPLPLNVVNAASSVMEPAPTDDRTSTWRSPDASVETVR